MKLLKSMTLATACLCLLAACAKKPQISALQSARNERAVLVSELKTKNVHVIEVGRVLRLILPVDAFFMPQTMQIKAAKKPVLEKLGDLIASFPQATIQVNGYSDNLGSQAEQQQRSLTQAQVVAAYLWNAGVPTDEVVVHGLGSQDAVASNATPTGAAANRRVDVLIRAE